MTDVDAARITHADRSATITHADRAAPVSHAVADQSAEGPLLNHLQFFADYENWSAGDPLPNRYPDNSGIQSLTDNNNVGAETGSPLVDSKSGSYGLGSNGYHSTGSYTATPSDFYVSAWIQLAEDTNSAIVSSLTTSPENWNFVYLSGGPLRFVVIIDGSVVSVDSSKSFSVGVTYFVEAWFTASNTTLHLRVDDGVEETKTASGSVTKADSTLNVGRRGGFGSQVFDGVLDNVAYEAAPAGELVWPPSSTDRYQAGGFSWNEIKTYQP